MLQLQAIYSGPVSLAVTVMAIRPLFVFILGIALSLGVSRVLDEPLEGRILAVKLAAIAMTVGRDHRGDAGVINQRLTVFDCQSVDTYSGLAYTNFCL